MNMNKKIMLLLTAACSAALLAGCSGEKGLVQDYSKKYVDLGAYTGLTVDRQITTITDEDLQSAIENERYMMAEYNEITDRAAKDGDVVVIDFAGTVDGEELEDGSMEDMELELGSDSFIDGFEDEIVGMKAGETKTFDITFPEPYDGILDGQLATFEVTLNEIYEVVMPEYNDEYVASVSDCSTVEEYEAQLRTSLEEEYAADAMDMACEDLLISVIDSSTFSGRPEELYESCRTAVETEEKSAMEDYGVDDIQEIYGEDYDQEAYILETMYERMVVYTIAAKEKLSVSDEEYQASLEEDMMYSEYLSTEEYEKSIGDITSYKYYLLRTKVLDFLGENNHFNDVDAELYYDTDDLDIEYLDEEDVEVIDEDADAEISDDAVSDDEVSDDEASDDEVSDDEASDDEISDDEASAEDTSETVTETEAESDTE